jgi:hypothetical protein
MPGITVEIRHFAKRAPLSKLADLAVAGEAIAVREGLELPVRKIGAAPSSEFRVSVVRERTADFGASARPPAARPDRAVPRTPAPRKHARGRPLPLGHPGYRAG